jgi:ribosomal protein S18 acetylase RimI-like enzyme
VDTSFQLPSSPHIAVNAGTVQSNEQYSASHAINTLQIRQLQWTDISAAADVIGDSFQIGGGWGGWLQPLFKIGICEDLRSRLQSTPTNQSVCLVAAVDDTKQTVVGTIEISTRSTIYNPAISQRYAYISNLAVDTGYRRLGIGQQLVSQCAAIAKDWGFNDIYLHVMASNPAGQQLYYKLGFEHLNSDRTWHLLPWRRAERLFLRKRL